jgi:TetR/AcrR family transcriptional regulator, cholesterol catabolism regulator
MRKPARSAVKPKSTALDEKGLKKATSIGKVAARLFNGKGYIETSLEDIASATKLSKGAIYHYFSSKDELLFFILNNYMDIILNGLEEDLGVVQDPVDKIRHIIKRHIWLYSAYPAEAKTLLHDTHCLPAKYFKIVADKQRTYFRILANSLPSLFTDTLTNDRLTVLTFSLFGMCNWIYAWYNPKGPVMPDQLSDTIGDIFLHGITQLENGINAQVGRRSSRISK